MTNRASEKFLTEEKVLIFLHIPKTAGTTLNKIIDRQFPHDTIFSLGPPIGSDLSKLKNLSKKEKQKIGCVKGHLAFGLHQWLPKPCIYTTLLRDPVDRIISEYYYMCRMPDLLLHKKLMYENMSLDDYARMYIEQEISNLQTRLISGYVDIDKLLPPYDPLPVEAIEIAKQNLSLFGVVGLTERFDETLLLMKRIFDWRNIFYTKQNIARDRPSKSEIPRKTIRMIEDHNKLDLELYEFAKQELEEQIREQGVLFKSELRTFRMLNKACGAAWRGLGLRKGKALIRSVIAR